ncbi:MAG TPA: PQQ-dependent sugar dehydrogenase [Pirellulales bacterium]|nr:PQQ-dependent sugar dehydrogenase [Pirellulales bacterium]
MDGSLGMGRTIKRFWWLWSLVALGVCYELARRWGLRTFLLLPLVWLAAIGGGYVLCRLKRVRWAGTAVLLAGAVYCSYVRGERFVSQSREAGRLAAALGRRIASQPFRWARSFRRESDPATLVRWTSSRLLGTPELPPPYQSRLAFPNLHFKNPVVLTWSESAERWFLAEEQGRVLSFADARETGQVVELIDVQHVIWGMAVHPRFAENGFLYVTYHDRDPSSLRVARFTANRQTGLVDRQSEKTIIGWEMLGHEGGCLEFGPDGYLYVSVGDKGAYDYKETGQDISDLHASILRLDVDHPPEGRAYAVPTDNPFVDTEGARPEIWSYGLRQVWKMSFDRETGELWAADVGQDLWESVHLIHRGDNCGWSLFEGAHPLFPERKRGPTPIVPPVVEQSHAVMRSITGGHVYHGAKLPELDGCYLYADYDTGTVWSIAREGDQPVVNTMIADTPLRISGFAIDCAGEVLILDHVGGQIFELAETPPTERSPAYVRQFPRKLSETGLFASTAKYQPAVGVIPYSVNSQLWSDGAYKDRFLAVNAGGPIDFEAIALDASQPGWNAWRLPNGAALVKTFWLELEPGKPESRRRVETRVMVVQDLPEDPTHRYKDMNKLWHVYSYAWNDAQTDAELVERDGLDRPYEINDPGATEPRRQVWHYPSRFECMMCHTKSAGYLLGVKTAQLNRPGQLGHAGENQLEFFDRARLLDLNASTAPPFLTKLVDPTDEQAPLELRARSYLHANCSHCHMPYGGGNSPLDLRYHVSLAEMNLIGRRPAHGDLRIEGALLVAPGDPERSLLYQRMNRPDTGRMPKVGSSVVDAFGTRLIRDWIVALGDRADEFAASGTEPSTPTVSEGWK